MWQKKGDSTDSEAMLQMKVVGSGIPGGWHGFHLMSGKHLHHVCGDLGHDIYNYHSELTHPQTAGL